MKRIFLSSFFFICAAFSFAYDVEVDGIYYNIVDGNAVVTCNDIGCYEAQSYTIPSKITVSGTEYPVTVIGENAFRGCYHVVSLSIPESVTSIGDYAFHGCNHITSLTIPETVTSIGNHAFSRCSGLTSLTIPNSVTSIGDFTFEYCSGLTAVNIPESITSIGYYTFSECSKLTTLAIPESVTSIRYEAFSHCVALTSLIIPNSVTNIEDGAFADCPGLTSLTIGNSVVSIGFESFALCKNLKTVTCLATQVPSANTDTFNSSNINNVTLFVPEAFLQSYKTTAPWSQFGTIKTIESTDIKNIAKPEMKKKVVKRIDDGKVIIEKGYKTYDLKGHRDR